MRHMENHINHLAGEVLVVLWRNMEDKSRNIYNIHLRAGFGNPDGEVIDP